MSPLTESPPRAPLSLIRSVTSGCPLCQAASGRPRSVAPMSSPRRRRSSSELQRPFDYCASRRPSLGSVSFDMMVCLSDMTNLHLGHSRQHPAQRIVPAVICLLISRFAADRGPVSRSRLTAESGNGGFAAPFSTRGWPCSGPSMMRRFERRAAGAHESAGSLIRSLRLRLLRARHVRSVAFAPLCTAYI